MTPTMQKNMKTRVHHAKLGKPPWMADIMLETKAMTQASCGGQYGARWLLVSSTHDADGDGGQGERVANDAANAEGRGALAGVAVAVS